MWTQQKFWTSLRTLANYNLPLIKFLEGSELLPLEHIKLSHWMEEDLHLRHVEVD